MLPHDGEFELGPPNHRAVKLTLIYSCLLEFWKVNPYCFASEIKYIYIYLIYHL